MMPPDPQDRGRRLRTARKSVGLRQEDVARHLGVVRTAVSRVESGQRALTDDEAERLTDLLGCDLRQDPCREEAPPEEDKALRPALELARTVTRLERLLRPDPPRATYALDPPASRWAALVQGERLADAERHRLRLGDAPLADVEDLLESQGVRTGEADLPHEVTVVTRADASAGRVVIVERHLGLWRRRQALAHGYGHVLAGEANTSECGTFEVREALAEVRANAFAAALLLPADGVRERLVAFGRGAFSSRADVDDGRWTVPVKFRPTPLDNTLRLHDVLRLAHHYGVAPRLAKNRLERLRLAPRGDWPGASAWEEDGAGERVAALFGLCEPEVRSGARARLLSLALEAFARHRVDRRELDAVGRRFGLGSEALDALLHDEMLSGRLHANGNS